MWKRKRERRECLAHHSTQFDAAANFFIFFFWGGGPSAHFQKGKRNDGDYDEDDDDDAGARDFAFRVRRPTPGKKMSNERSGNVSEVEEHVSLKYEIKKRLGKGVSVPRLALVG